MNMFNKVTTVFDRYAPWMKGIFVAGLCWLAASPVSYASVSALQSTQQAQTTLEKQVVLNKKVADSRRQISLKLENESLASALLALAKQARVGLSLQALVIPDKKVTIDLHEVSVFEALDALLKGTGLEAVLPPSRDVLVIRRKLDQSLKIQLETVSGTVTDAETGETLPGVNVVVKGTTTGTATDAQGRYSLNVPSLNDTLIFSFIGFQTQEVGINGRTEINARLYPQAVKGDELVVIGYRTTKQKNILGSVSSINTEDVVQTTPVNTLDAMRGRIAGVNIKTNGGPGAGSSIQIRGPSTFNAGSEPLYVVDGQQLENIDNLDPNTIENVQVLKDGASAAIYGSRAANGVVVITTKSGVAGDLKLDVNYSQSFNTVNSEVPLANTRQRLFYEDKRRGQNATGLTGTQRDSLSLLLRNSNNLHELLTRTSARSTINVAVSGGGETSSYYWNTGFTGENGVIVNSDYNRVNTTLKVNADIVEKLDIGTVFDASYEIQSGLDEFRVFQHMVERIPYYPVFEPNGTFTPIIAGRRNPLAQAVEMKDEDRDFRARSFTDAVWNIIPSLQLKSTLGANFRFRKIDEFVPTTVLRPGRSPQGRQRNFLNYNILQENILTYEENLGNHNIGGIAGISFQKWKSEDTFLRSREFLFNEIQTFNAIKAGGFLENNTGTFKESHGLISFFGELSYDYKEKYLVSGTLRRDGSSRFGSNRRYGNFLSGSVGWRISEESFIQKATDFFSNILIRASYGENGNESIGNYENRTLYNTGSFYNGVNGVAPGSTLGNNDIGWENTVSQNLGLDLSMLEERINVSIDVWNKSTEDLLASVALPAESGFNNIRTNLGEVENKGIDLTLSGVPLRTNNFEWFSSFNISTLNNEVVDIADERGFFYDGIYRIEEGEPLGNMFGYKNLGVFRYDESNAFTGDGTQLTPNFTEDGTFTNYTLNGEAYTGEVNQITRGGTVLGGGDIHWQDVNGDFLITAGEDRQIIGNGLANYYGGFFNEFSYNEFSLSFLFDFNLGNDIFRNYDQRRNDLNSRGETPSPERIEGAWLEPGDRAEYATLERLPQNRLINSQYVSEGDYIKLRNIRFTYTMPPSLLQKLGFVNTASMHVSVNNLLTWTNYTGYNPELGNRGDPLQPGFDTLRYPINREIILGLKFQF